MNEKNLITKLINIFKKSKSITLVFFIIMIIITFSPALITIPIELLFGKEAFDEIIWTKMQSIIIIWEKYKRLFIIPIIADILFVIIRFKHFRKEDFINNELMYREIIDKYSVIGLAYVDSFREETYKYVAITLLSLQLKGRIQLKDDEIVIINTKDQYALRESEQVVLNSIASGKLIIKDSNYFKSLAKKEAIEDKLIKDDKEMKRNSLKLDRKMIKSFLIYIIGISVIFFNVSTVFSKWTGEYFKAFEVFEIAVYLLSVVYLATAICINAIVKSISAENAERTELGEEINIKLEGLKNYVRKYSLLHKRDKKELELWREYLIYSVMFGQNKKIVEDLKKIMSL